eukprot:11172228-Lingulodinium_polyedra.AAC.1
MIGPRVATAAGSRRQTGLSSPNTTSAAKRPVPCMAADLAARRRPSSSAAGGAPHAAPYIPAPVPAAAPMVHRARKGTGRRARRPNRPIAPRMRSAATGARRAGPACAETPRSLKQ